MNERIDVTIRKFRSRMTSYPPGMCPLALYRSILHISMNQSCGKCVPCRDGLGEVDYYPGQVMYLCADIAELKSDTGFAPEYTFKNGIEKTIKWYKERKNS